MSVTLSLNTREFQQAMREYVAATGKDSVEALKRQGKNFAIHCLQSVRKSKGAAAIRGLAAMPWWPKMIAGIIKKQAGSFAASLAYQSMWSAEQKKIRDAAGRKGAWKLTREETSYVKYAKKLSRDILGSRVKAIWFLSAFFRVLANKLGNSTSGKQFNGIQSLIRLSTSGGYRLVLDSSYAFRKRGSKTAASSERLLQDAMNRALPLTIQDMRDYTAKKLAERSRQYSGRAA